MKKGMDFEDFFNKNGLLLLPLFHAVFEVPLYDTQKECGIVLDT